MKHLPFWAFVLVTLLTEDPPDVQAPPPKAPKPRLRTRLHDWLGRPRPADEPVGFEW